MMDWIDAYKALTHSTVEPPALAPEDYREALLSQSACNLSGIVTSFSRILKKVWDESRRYGQGTDWVNKHPICRLYAEQIIHLTDVPQGFMIDGSYSVAYDFCEQEALKTLKEGERPPWRI